MSAPRFADRLAARLSRFRHDKAANIAVIFAIALIPLILPLKTLLASVTATATEPLPLMAAAAMKPSEFCEIAATLAASAAACSLALILDAIE